MATPQTIIYLMLGLVAGYTSYVVFKAVFEIITISIVSIIYYLSGYLNDGMLQIEICLLACVGAGIIAWVRHNWVSIKLFILGIFDGRRRQNHRGY